MYHATSQNNRKLFQSFDYLHIKYQYWGTIVALTYVFHRRSLHTTLEQSWASEKDSQKHTILKYISSMQQTCQFHQVTTSCSKPVDNEFWQSTCNKSVDNLQQTCRQQAVVSHANASWYRFVYTVNIFQDFVFTYFKQDRQCLCNYRLFKLSRGSTGQKSPLNVLAKLSEIKTF